MKEKGLKKRLASCLMFSALMAGATFLVNGSPVFAAPITLDFYHGITAADGQFLTDLIKKFEKENPSIKIKQQTFGWEQMFEKVVVTLAAGKPPELFVVHPEEFYWFLKSNAFRSLNEYVNGPNGIPKEDRVPSAWKVVEQNSKIFGVPLDNHNHNMYINLDLFAQNGLDPNNPPRNREQFLLAAKKITKLRPDGKTYEKMGFTYSWLRTTYLSLLKQYGGTLLNEDKTRATFNSEAGYKALQEMADWRLKDKIGDWGGVDAFLKGKAGILFEGPWWIGSMYKAKNLKWAPAEMPTFGTEKGCWTSGHIMFIPPNVKGKQLNAAWKFVKWMSDHSNEWARAGQIPVRKSHLNSKEFKELPTQYTFSKMLPYSYFEPSVRKQSDMRNTYEPMIDQAVNGKGDVKQLTDKAADRINKILASTKN